jgi:tetratricopeptide (TPR) repeat protein
MINWIGKLFSRPSEAATASDIPPPPSEPDARAIEDLKSQGEGFLHAGKLELAEQSYRQAVLQTPADARAHISLGFVLKELGRDEEAEKCLGEAIRLDPSIADSHYLLGTLLQKHGDSQAAAASFRNALDLAPDFEFAYRDLCVLLMQSGDLAQARELMQAGVAKNPNSADMHFYLGNLYQEEQAHDRAIASYRKALELQPDRAGPLSNLAMALIRSGKADEALPVLQKALALAPDMAATFANALLQAGRIDDAIDCLRQSLAIAPDSVESHFHLASVLQQLGGHEEARAAYHRVIELKPDFAEAYFYLGNMCAQAAQFEEAEACYRQAIVYNPQFADALNNLGSVQCDLGRPDAALASYRRALQIAPEFAEAHSNLAEALNELGQHDAAIASHLRALEIKPDFAGAYINLGNVYRNCGRAEEAMASYRKAFELDPQNALAMFSLSIVLRFENRALEAEAACRKALEIDPNLVDAIVALGLLRADQGQFDEAEELFHRAISMDADSALAWASIARIRKMTVDDQGWLDRVLAIVEQGLIPRQEVYLRYAIGKYFDDVGNSDAAFANFQRANDLSKAYAPKFDQAEHTKAVDQLVHSFDAAWVEQRQAAANSSGRPILIVGMPRSGTTLAEQIIASHPSIFGAGELPFWSNAIPLNHVAAVKQGLDDAALSHLAKDYLRYLDVFSSDALHVVDKMPFNFMFLGIVKAAFPNARIIHLTRDAIDTSLSIYFQPFETSNTFANDLGNIAHFYREYLRVMAHWESTLPAGAILTVPYESLVDDPQTWSRKMIDFIGVPWDDRCLDFHKSERTVITASNWQVRQKISKSSVLRWRKYEKHLGPLLNLQSQSKQEPAD